MVKRTSPKDVKHIRKADDFEIIVCDKRSSWRATPKKARRRQRRYKKQLLVELVSQSIKPYDEIDG